MVLCVFLYSPAESNYAEKHLLTLLRVMSKILIRTHRNLPVFLTSRITIIDVVT